MPSTLIQFTDVKKSFDNRQVLAGVNMNIHSGEITAIIGKSGTGKSVLLKHIIGLMTPDSGEILIWGESLKDLELARKRKFQKKLSYMFQDNALFDF